ncbi:MAG: 2,4-dienoyl-CoA reductase, partial [Myxococcales bacterium]|nr:2,4-dienoyl-CoA reductase [Myxococcales bacterium]
FGRAAGLVKAAGFTGVQIHGAHGYLASQFLSPHHNRRDDAWGGTPEKRRRFVLEVYRAIRAAVGPAFPVSIKLNSADFQRGGFSEEDSMAVLDALADRGLDLLEISGGTYESAAMFEETVPQHDSSKRREAFFLDYAEKARARATMPILVTGGFRTAAAMQDALDSGALDVIGMARPLAVEPDLSARLLSGEATSARPIQLATGVKEIDGFIQAAWYQTQIERAAAGEAPDPELSRVLAAIRYLGPRTRFDGVDARRGGSGR